MAKGKKRFNNPVHILQPGTAEHSIAMEQMYRLQKISNERLFTPEEYRLYEVLVKSLKLLVEEQPKSLPVSYSEVDLDDRQLIKIAQNEKSLTDGQTDQEASTDVKPSRGH